MSCHLALNLGLGIAVGAVVKNCMCSVVVKPDVNVGVGAKVDLRAISAHELKLYATSDCC